MKRKYLIAVTGFVLSFSLLSFPVYAADEPVQPEIPEVQTEESVAEYNSQVDTYNAQVDEYNQQVDNDYNQQVAEQQEIAEYNQKEQERVDNLNAAEEEKVAAHNEEEDLKVEQNKEDLAQYEQDVEQYEQDKVQYEQDLEQYEKNSVQYQADLKNEQIVKTYYNAESVEDYNMKPFETPDEEEYERVLEQAVDRRVVREQNTALKDKKFSSTIEVVEASEKALISYTVSIIHHFVDNYFQDIHTETFEEKIDINDTVTITSLANNNTGTKTVLEGDKTYPIFFAYISDKYLSYYWYEAFAKVEYTSLENEDDFTNEYENGDKYTYTLKNGKKYYSDTPYFSVDYYYMPYLTINKPIEPEEPTEPTEPEKVEKYVPQYWTVKYEKPNLKENITPVKDKHLDKINYLIYKKEQKEEEKKQEEPPKEEKETRRPVTPSQEPAEVTPEPVVTPSEPAPAPSAPRYYAPRRYTRYTYTVLNSGLTVIDDEPVPLASPIDPAKTADNNAGLIQSLCLAIICSLFLLALLIYFKRTQAEL